MSSSSKFLLQKTGPRWSNPQGHPVAWMVVAAAEARPVALGLLRPLASGCNNKKKISTHV